MTLADKIKKLTNAYGVSGDEFRVAKIAAELMAPYCDRVETDDFGNVFGYRDCGIPGAKTVMLDAHIDQIGFLVTEVTKEGFLRFTTVGGVDQRMLLGSELTVLTKKGPILGIVAAIPPHLQKDGDDKKSVPIPEMVVDIGMTGEQAKKAVAVGDYMAFANDAMELQGDALCGKAFDDRACLVCLLHTMDLLQGKADVGVQFLSLRGQLNIAAGAEKKRTAQTLLQILDRPGHIGLIAVQGFCGPGEAAVLGNKVKDTVGIQTDVHGTVSIHIKLVWNPSQLYILLISLSSDIMRWKTRKKGSYE